MNFRFIVLLAIILFPFFGMGQHPGSYQGVKQNQLSATFSFQNNEREVIKTKGATFHIESPCDLRFQILVSADGTVKYVKAPRCSTGQNQMRLACADALYAHKFAALPEGTEDAWITVDASVELD